MNLLNWLGISAYLVGRDNEAVAAWEHAYNRHAGDGNRAEAWRGVRFGRPSV